MCVCREDVNVHTEAGCKKAESLYKELALMISEAQQSLRAQPSYVLEQTLDFSTACLLFKVKQAVCVVTQYAPPSCSPSLTPAAPSAPSFQWLWAP